MQELGLCNKLEQVVGLWRTKTGDRRLGTHSYEQESVSALVRYTNRKTVRSFGAARGYLGTLNRHAPGNFLWAKAIETSSRLHAAGLDHGISSTASLHVWARVAFLFRDDAPHPGRRKALDWRNARAHTQLLLVTARFRGPTARDLYRLTPDMLGDLIGTQLALAIRVAPHIARSAFQMGHAIVGHQALIHGRSHRAAHPCIRSRLQQRGP